MHTRIIVGSNMAMENEIKGLEEQKENLVEQIRRIRDEAVLILAEDLTLFPERELRRRFVTNRAFAEALDEKTIKAIKQEARAKGAWASKKAITMMQEDERWLAGVRFEGAGKSFAENSVLWEPTQVACEMVTQMLVSFGFPDADTPVEYKMPTWFIKGKYLPSLAEKYWATIAELKEVNQRMQEGIEALQREALAKKWDSVKPD
jgi:hypothetical protein